MTLFYKDIKYDTFEVFGWYKTNNVFLLTWDLRIMSVKNRNRTMTDLYITDKVVTGEFIIIKLFLALTSFLLQSQIFSLKSGVAVV